MQKTLWYPAIVATAVFGVLIGSNSGHAQGGKKRVTAALSGYQEDPVISTTGHGTFIGVIDANASLFEYTLAYEDLEGSPTLAAHIHFGSRDHNGGVMAFLCGGGGKPACPDHAAFVTGMITAADVIGPNAQGIEPGAFQEFLKAVRAAHAYVNVHTGRWPAGEIRGQINDANQRD